MSLNGLQYDKQDFTKKFELTGERNFQNHNPFDLLNRPKSLSSVPDSENPYLHDDFYGYNHADDVSTFSIIFFIPI